MLDHGARALKRFVLDESGQGITEYGAVLAFVALLIGVMLLATQNLKDAVSQAFSKIVKQMQTVATTS